MSSEVILTYIRAIFRISAIHNTSCRRITYDLACIYTLADRCAFLRSTDTSRIFTGNIGYVLTTGNRRDCINIARESALRGSSVRYAASDATNISDSIDTSQVRAI